MIRVARRDHATFRFDVADLRELPFEDASLVGVVCWYSLIFLAPADRPAAYGELCRVVKPGGYLVTAFKAGAAGGVETLATRMERSVTDAGFTTVFWGGVPADGPDSPAQGYLLAQKA